MLKEATEQAPGLQQGPLQAGRDTRTRSAPPQASHACSVLTAFCGCVSGSSGGPGFVSALRALPAHAQLGAGGDGCDTAGGWMGLA